MSKVIQLFPKKESEDIESVDDIKQSLMMRQHKREKTEDMADKMHRIKKSLERINKLMREIKAKEKYNDKS